MTSRATKRFGKLAVACGVPALFLAFAADHAYVIRDWHTWFVFDLMEQLGLIHPATGAPPELREFNIFSLNEANAIAWTYAASVSLGISAMLAAILADHRSEDTLYPGAGFICGALSIEILDRGWGVLAMVLGFSVVQAIRTRRRNG